MATSSTETIHSTTSQSAGADRNSVSAKFSTGAMAVITVGYVIAVLATGAAIAFLIRSRRRNRKSTGLQESGDVDQATKDDQQQQQGPQHQYQTRTVELDGHTGPSEFPGTRLLAEM